MNRLSCEPTQIGRPKIRRVRSAPSYRQPPPEQPLRVSGFHLYRNIESEFQSELGKNLFEKTVELEETSTIINLTTGEQGKPSAKDEAIQRLTTTTRPSSCCWRQCDKSPHVYNDKRRCVNIRDTHCKSPLVTGNKNFMSYFKKGQLDTISVAKSRGFTDLPVPNIGKCVKRVRSANIGSLKQLSLKDLYFDDSVEDIRGNYWRSKIVEKEEAERLKVVEGFCLDIIADLYDGPVSDEIYFLERRKQLLQIKKSIDEQTENWLNRVKEEAKREADQRETERKLLTSKHSKRKNSRKKRPKSILKNRLRSRSSDNGDSAASGSKDGKSVRFREKLTDTKIIGRSKTSSSKKRQKKTQEEGRDHLSKGENKSTTAGGRILSPKRKSGKKAKTFPGYISSEKVSNQRRKKKKKKTKLKDESFSLLSSKDTVTMETKKNNDVPPAEIKVQDNILDCLAAKISDIVSIDEPPNFSLADEYQTKKEMVADWLQNKYCSAAPKTLPLL